MPVSIPQLPPDQRPRERLWSKGVEALSDIELLALVLRHGRPGESAIELAAALLAEYDGLAGLAGAMPEELAARRGIGPAKAAAVVAALRLGRRAELRSPSPAVRSPQDLVTTVRRELIGLRRERALVVVLDAGNRIRRVVPLSEGAIDHSLLPVREVLNAVLRHDGRAFAVAHNHPSGDPEPSESDIQITRELAAAAKVVGLRFLDHLIVTDEGWTSLRAAGQLG